MAVDSTANHLKATESAAIGGDHEKEMALIHEVRDLDQSGSLKSVGKYLQAHGQTVRFDSKSDEVTDIDFGQISVHRQTNGDFAAVRRDDKGHVAELCYDDGGTLKFNYGDDKKTVISTDQVNIKDGVPQQPIRTEANADFQIYVNHDGDLTVRRFLGDSIRFTIDGKEELELNRVKATGELHGDKRQVDTVEYPPKNSGDPSTTRKFEYSGNEIFAFTDPRSSERFARGTAYTDAGRSGHEYYRWVGSKGHSWDGTVTPDDPGKSMPTTFAVTGVVDGAMVHHPFKLNVMDTDEGISQ